jgi:predicted metalloendopeptidase
MAPLIAPDYWMNSQLSIARFYGGCVILGDYYYINKESNYLVRADLRVYVEKLGFDTVKKAVQRYSDLKKAREVMKRLTKIVKARKRAEKAKETKEETLFEL